MSEFALEVENLVKVYASRRKAPIRAVDGMSFRVPSGIIFGLLGPNGAGKSTLLRMLSTLTLPTEGSAKILGYDVVKKPIEVRKRISSVIQATAVELLLSVKDNLLTYARFQGLDKATAVLRAEVEKGRTIILTTQVLSEAEELCDDILIINRGKQIARGDLNTLKLLSEGVYEITLAFDHLPDNIQAEIAALSPIRSAIEANAIDLALKIEESRVMEVVSALSRNRHVLRVEVRGASLEDIFVELTTREGRELK